MRKHIRLIWNHRKMPEKKPCKNPAMLACDAKNWASFLRSSDAKCSETWVPKRGGLKPAGKRQESATFLQRSFFDVAVQFFVCCSAAFGPNDFRIAEKPMLQCSFCSAAFRKLQRNLRFRLWHVAGAGFRGVGCIWAKRVLFGNFSCFPC